MTSLTKDILIVICVISGILFTLMIAQCVVKRSEEPPTLEEKLESCQRIYEEVMNECCCFGCTNSPCRNNDETRSSNQIPHLICLKSAEKLTEECFQKINSEIEE